MENASKALIIAGAILLAILLISLGIMIFNQASSTLEGGGGMNDAQKSTFNARLQKYEGSIKGSQLKALINEIVSINNDDNDENNITLDSTSTADNKSIDNTGWIKTTTTYKVSFPTYTNGLITAIKIDK